MFVLSFLLLLLAPAIAQTPQPESTPRSIPVLVPDGILKFELGELKIPRETGWNRMEIQGTAVFAGVDRSHPQIQYFVTHLRRRIQPSLSDAVDIPRSYAERFANSFATSYKSQAVGLRVETGDATASFSFQLSTGTMVYGWALLGGRESLVITSIGAPQAELAHIVASFKPATGRLAPIPSALDARESLANRSLLICNLANAFLVLLSVGVAALLRARTKSSDGLADPPRSAMRRFARNTLATVLVLELVAAAVFVGVRVHDAASGGAIFGYFSGGMLFLSGLPVMVLTYFGAQRASSTD